jgi:hypothetical protein
MKTPRSFETSKCIRPKKHSVSHRQKLILTNIANTRGITTLNTQIIYLSLLDPLESKINLNFIQKCSSYRAVNTFRLGHENQL